jgi:predicted RNase H-like nuclease (RuvC/YqgF family)
MRLFLEGEKEGKTVDQKFTELNAKVVELEAKIAQQHQDLTDQKQKLERGFTNHECDLAISLTVDAKKLENAIYSIQTWMCQTNSRVLSLEGLEGE